MTAYGLKGTSWKPSTRSCPVDRCPHPVYLHDIPETPVRIEVCTVPDCDCSGIVQPRQPETPPLDGREEIADWAEFVHHRLSERVHVLPFEPTHFGIRATLCGRTPSLFQAAWRGTNTPEEQAHARQMPLCIRCSNLVIGRAA